MRLARVQREVEPVERVDAVVAEDAQDAIARDAVAAELVDEVAPAAFVGADRRAVRTVASTRPARGASAIPPTASPDRV
jgi:hypothetical protein